MPTCDITVVGAGPYGLSAGAHLRAANGLDVRVFGETMAFWERHMPTGMLLRSPREASDISDPKRVLTLDAAEVGGDDRLSARVRIDRFIQYGRWFQQQAVPDIDPRKVTRVETDTRGFRITLEDREVWKSRRVIVATGISAFAWRPSEFVGLPVSLVSHTSDHRDLGRFAGEKVLVIGGGQSGLESGALLHEAGAGVEVVVRAPQVHWLSRSAKLHRLGPMSRLLYHPTDVGPAGVSHLVARPNWFRRLPRWLQDWLGLRSIRAAGAGWLRPRLRDVPITTGRSVVSAVPVGGRLSITLDDGSDRRVDHVPLGTGYRVDISRYGFLAEELLGSIRQINGFPCLDAGFESSVPGLHFLGAPAAWSFGPLMRFVAGTAFASREVTRRILGKAMAWESSEGRDEVKLPGNG